MKKLSVLCIIILLGSLYSSCKKDDSDVANATINLSKTDIAKVASLIKEATELFNAGNKIIAATKAEQAKGIFNAVFIPGRKIIISDQCPIKHVYSDDSMIIMTLGCNDFINKQPANRRGAFEENIMIFTVSYNQSGAQATDKALADKVKKTPAGTTFTGTIQISDPGVLIEAEDDFISSYSMNYNIKILEIEKAGK